MVMVASDESVKLAKSFFQTRSTRLALAQKLSSIRVSTTGAYARLSRRPTDSNAFA